MAPLIAPGDPRESPKPQPLGNFALTFLFTTCTICALFLLWKRAASVRTVVAHQLAPWTRGGEGVIRLSVDDGPPSHEFLDEHYDEDNEHITDDEPLSLHAQRLQAMHESPPEEELIHESISGGAPPPLPTKP